MVTWEEWYKDKRDELTINLGQMITFSTRPLGGEWGKFIIEHLRGILDVIDVVWGDIRKSRERLDKIDESLQVLENTLDKRDKDITGILTNVQEWMKKYRPILDEVEKDYSDKLRRVKET